MLNVNCPKCGVISGAPCDNSLLLHPTTMPHAERITAAREDLIARHASSIDPPPAGPVEDDGEEDEGEDEANFN